MCRMQGSLTLLPIFSRKQTSIVVHKNDYYLQFTVKTAFLVTVREPSSSVISFRASQVNVPASLSVTLSRKIALRLLLIFENEIQYTNGKVSKVVSASNGIIRV